MGPSHDTKTKLNLARDDLSAERSRRYSAYYLAESAEIEKHVRRCVFGEDLGQRSWNQSDDLVEYARFLDLGPDRLLLDLACGFGGVDLFFNHLSNTKVIGYDVNPGAISDARRATEIERCEDSIRFECVDLEELLPLQDATVDAILINDAICHIAERAQLFAECYRVLRSGGKMIVTDPLVITGVLSNHEVVARNMRVPYYYSAAGVNDALLCAANFEVLSATNTTERLVTLSQRWLEQYKLHEQALRQINGDSEFDLTIEQLKCVFATAGEGRLSRYLYKVRKT